jgi:2-polyprenyl-6-methoxyphenol hydroxylase-like FAD-dependent oxidoreductase
MTPIHAEPDSDTDVLIVGAGPTGLAVGSALTARGVRTTVIDRLVEGANTSRAAVVHARTLEVLESLGVSARLASLGVHAQRFTIRDPDRLRQPADALFIHVDGVTGRYRARAAAAPPRAH